MNKRTLAAIGRELAIDDQLILGSGELRTGGAQRESTLADAVEALIGAVLVDSGIESATQLVDRLIGSRLAGLPAPDELKDPKTRLQEWLQGRGHDRPVYTVDAQTGSDHERVFRVICAVDELDLRVEGEGRSRRSAEQSAAASMLEHIADG